MARNEVTDLAALFGLAGTVLVTGGSVIASMLFAKLGPWVGAVPAVLVWGACVFYGMKQFAHGIYAVVEDAKAQ